MLVWTMWTTRRRSGRDEWCVAVRETEGWAGASSASSSRSSTSGKPTGTAQGSPQSGDAASSGPASCVRQGDLVSARSHPKPSRSAAAPNAPWRTLLDRRRAMGGDRSGHSTTTQRWSLTMLRTTRDSSGIFGCRGRHRETAWRARMSYKPRELRHVRHVTSVVIGRQHARLRPASRDSWEHWICKHYRDPARVWKHNEFCIHYRAVHTLHLPLLIKTPITCTNRRQIVSQNSCPLIRF